MRWDTGARKRRVWVRDAGPCVALLVVLSLVVSHESGWNSLCSSQGALPSRVQIAPGTVGLFRTKSLTLRSGGTDRSQLRQGESPLKPGNPLTLFVSGSKIAWELPIRRSKGDSRRQPCVACIAPSFRFGGLGRSAGAAYAYASFRGSMIAMVDSGSLAANAVDIEDYVQSVVGGEMIDLVALRGRQAQAVAVRLRCLQDRIKEGSDGQGLRVCFRR